MNAEQSTHNRGIRRTALVIGIVVIVAVVALVVGLALLEPGGTGWGGSGNGDYGYGYMMGGGGSFWLWMLLPGAFFLILLFVLVFVILAPSSSSYVPAHSLPSASRNPREELEGRYVRGEISREDYLRIRDDLSITPPGGRV